MSQFTATLIGQFAAGCCSSVSRQHEHAQALLFMCGIYAAFAAHAMSQALVDVCFAGCKHLYLLYRAFGTEQEAEHFSVVAAVVTSPGVRKGCVKNPVCRRPTR